MQDSDDDAKCWCTWGRIPHIICAHLQPRREDSCFYEPWADSVFRFQWCPCLGLSPSTGEPFLAPSDEHQKWSCSFCAVLCFSCSLFSVSSLESKSEKWFPSTRTTQLFPLPPEAVCIQDRKDPVSPPLRYNSEIYGNVQTCGIYEHQCLHLLFYQIYFLLPSARFHHRSDLESLGLQEVTVGAERKTCKVTQPDRLLLQEERGFPGEAGAKGHGETALVMGKLLAQWVEKVTDW